MPLYVADAMDVGEREELRRHLAAGCVACAGWLAEAVGTFAAVGLTLDPVRPSPAVLKRLMDRVDATGRPNGVGLNRTATTRPAWVWQVLAPLATAAAAAVVTLSVVNARQPARDAKLVKGADDRATLLQFVLDSQNRTVGELQARLAEQRQLAEALQKPTTAVVSLAGVGQTRAAARLVWDAAGGRAVLLTTGLTPPPAGRTYELWYIVGQKPIRGTTFGVGPDGSAVVAAAIPAGMGRLAQTAVSDEPAGGTDAPTGSIQLAGKL